MKKASINDIYNWNLIIYSLKLQIINNLFYNKKKKLILKKNFKRFYNSTLENRINATAKNRIQQTPKIKGPQFT